MYEETQNNQEESKELSEKTRRNIVNEFEKENTSVLKKMKNIFSKKQDEKEQLSKQTLQLGIGMKQMKNQTLIYCLKKD